MLFYVLVLAVLVLAAVQFFMVRAFRSRTLALGAALRGDPGPVDVSDGLPPLVRAFALKSGADPAHLLRIISFTQEVELRRVQGARFDRYMAWQVAATGKPGFLWQARQDAGPFTKLRVVDAFVDGDGHLEARLMASIPVARADGPDLALAEAYRYLAELPWVPDAILGNLDLRWQMAGDRTASVSLQTKGGAAHVAFLFDADGDIVAMRAKGRPATDAAGKPARYDWQGTFGGYAVLGPRRVPVTGEVGYIYPTGYEAYFRARLTEYHAAD